MPRVSTIDTARAVALYGEYRSVVRVAEALGAAVSSVWRALKRAGVTMDSAAARLKALNADPAFKAKISAASSERLKALNADPAFKAKASERMKALHADPAFKAKRLASRRGVEVPAWVPADLVEDYVDVARLSGEEYAAAHVRALKRQAGAA